MYLLDHIKLQPQVRRQITAVYKTPL